MVSSGRRGGSLLARGLWSAALALSVAGCIDSTDGRDVHRAFNSRDTGPWFSIGRRQGADGSLVVHVLALRPEHGEDIAYHIVRQNFATSAVPIHVIVDPASGRGERQVFLWDGQRLTSGAQAPADAPPRAATPGHEPAAPVAH